MRTTRGTAAGLAFGLALLAGCVPDGQQTAPPRVTGAGELRLVPFDSCRQALEELQAAAAPYVGPYGFAFGSDAGRDRAEGESAVEAPLAATARRGAAAPGHSTTNTHEAGVDEPDLVKTDGRRIVTIADGVLRVVDAASRKQTGRVRIASATSWTEFLMYGDHALALLADHPGYRHPLSPGDSARPEQLLPVTELVLVDLSGQPEVLSRMTLDGGYVDARMVDGVVRLVTRSRPRVPFTHPGEGTSPAQAQRKNYTILGGTTVDDWLPGYEIDNGGTVTRGRVSCDQVRHPVTYSATSMLTVLSLDLRAGVLSGERSVSILADGGTVYGTGGHLYVVNDRRHVRPVALEDEPVRPHTEIYKFDVSSTERPRHTATGVVPGWLINQYAMSEHDGYLRIATTTYGEAGGARDRPATESAVHVLTHQGERLVRVGKVGGLGKGERIYAVRFIGAMGYVVTFRQVDPLYVVDLHDPEQPAVTGELKITGYSAYLHPAPGDRLIGVGQEANRAGRTLGLQVSLFDVSDPAAPSRLAQYHVRFAHSGAEHDPHAFLYWARTGLLAIPVTRHDTGTIDRQGARPPQPDVLVLRVSGASLRELGTVRHPAADHQGRVERSLVIGESLWTVSRAGLAATDTHTLDREAWVPFR